MAWDVNGFLERARSISEIVRASGSVLVVSHIDADGISSAAIARRCLERAGIEHEVRFVRSLGEKELNMIRSASHNLVWACDLGATFDKGLDDGRCVITDHHRPFEGGQMRLDQFGGDDHILNPMLFGFDGGTHLSGAGTTYFVAREIDASNKDLSCLAIVGAVGDLQDRQHHRLSGPLHEMVIEDAGPLVKVLTNELPFFGWVTRSAAAMLAFSNELKSLGYNEGMKEIPSLFYRNDVQLRRPSDLRGVNGREASWRSWSELSDDERRRMMLVLRNRLEELGLNYQALDGMLGEVYIFPENPEGSPTREAREFATLLNASGRYILTSDAKGDDERAELILNVCADPRIFPESALRNLDDHRMRIREGLAKVHRVVQMEHIQYLAPNNKGRCLNVSDTILGIIVGMALDQRTDGRLPLDRSKPLVALAERLDTVEKGKDPEVKVSVRMARELVESGVNLGRAVGEASTKARGMGGGHDVAAGANIPKKQIGKFLKALDQEIGRQKASFSPSGRP